MKIVKRLLPLAIALIIALLPVRSAFAAYTTVKASDFNIISGITETNFAKLFDNDSTTFARLPGNSMMKLEFKIVSDVKGIGVAIKSGTGPIEARYYDSDYNKLIVGAGNTYSKVKYMEIVTASSMYADMVYMQGEVSPIPIEHTELESLVATATDNTVSLSWTNPSNNSYFSGSKLYRDGNLIKTLSTTENSFIDSSVTANTTYSYKVVATYTDGFTTTGLTKEITTQKHDEVSNLSSEVTYNSVSLSWENPTSTHFTGVKVYKGNELLSTLNNGETTFVDDNLQDETSYSYKIISLYDDGVNSEGSTITATTNKKPEPVADVTGLKGEATHNKVTLSFTVPDTDQLSNINVYRDGLKISDSASSPFEDSTVSPSTTYEYTVKTVSIDGVESEGIKVQVTTKEEPPPKMGGTTFEETPEGDYKITWTEPTTGQVKIFVGGVEYATVPAEQGSFTIPKEDMKYTALGDADVELQPISESGKIGSITQSPKLDKVNVPFTVNDLVGTGNNLLWLIGPFLLLALSFLLVPKFRVLLMESLKKIKGEKETDLLRLEQRRFQAEAKELKEKQEKAWKDYQERQTRGPVIKEPRERMLKQALEPKTARIRAEKPLKVERAGRLTRESRMSDRQPRDSKRIPREWRS